MIFFIKSRFKRLLETYEGNPKQIPRNLLIKNLLDGELYIFLDNSSQKKLSKKIRNKAGPSKVVQL